MRLYRWLLKLYPAGFREEYGAPLARQFADEYREARGGWARAALWLRALSDLAGSIPTEFARELRQDLAYAGRVYRRRPLATLLALTALALAIGATSGVFSVLNALLIRSLPFRHPERLATTGYSPGDRAQFRAWRHGSPYLQDAAMYSYNDMNLSLTAAAARVRVTETSAGFFALLGTEPELGRAFRDVEDIPGKDGIAVIAYGLWQQMFGGDTRALGATIHVNGAPLTVVGIAPPAFDFPAKTAIWTPTFFDIERLGKSGALFDNVILRLKSGISVAQADALFRAELHRVYPGQDAAGAPRLISLRDQLAGPVRQAAVVLLAVVAFVLLIACANVAHLLLSRITERRQEMAIRAALGASRARLTQQLITESIVLTMGAAAAGLAVARWAARLAASVQPAPLAAQSYAVLDWRVLAFSAAVALLTGVLFGVLPAWLMGHARPGVRTPGISRARVGLVAMQAACTLVLLAGSVTMGRSFLRLLGTDLGFRTQNLATVTVSLFGSRYDADHKELPYYRQALDHLRAVPGVESAAGVDYLPLGAQAVMLLPARLDSGEAQGAVPVTVTPHYFATIGATVVDGRDFTEADREGSEPVTIVSDEFARRLAPARVIGRKITTLLRKEPLTIVGVVRSVRFWVGPASLAQFYLPAAQHPRRYMTFVARVHGNPDRYLAVCRDAIRQVDPQLPVYDAMTLAERLRVALAQPRFYTTAVLFLAGFALLLAIVGVYGVASYSISQRTHEIGVRLAVGATPARLRFALLRQSMLPLAAGMLGGAAAALALGRFLEHLMYGAQPVDARTCAAAAVLLAMAAALAVWTATARLLRFDPMGALRVE